MNMKKSLIAFAILAIAAVALITACDSRQAISRSKPQVSFSAEMTAVKDLSLRKDIARIEFKRDNEPFSDGVISIGLDTILSAGDGIYFAQTPFLRLFAGGNPIVFSSTDDLYQKGLSFSMPDSFRITSVNPRASQTPVNVNIQWSFPSGATGLILSVFSTLYHVDNTSPLTLVLPAGTSTYRVPDTTFEDNSYNTVTGTYYIYLVAFNGSFGTYPGIAFPLPDNLPPAQAISNPSGHLRYGTVAQYDSIRIF
ncbi:MAG TPA: hypothetical protein DEO84_02485 [candidate division Zixibacteria bacterium]|nr:hypothetical protein [candidate division Zixibacteria bacterium]HBZ00165.1 hypothetical protein [candidate division Zixibacteria bacterium]